MPQGGVVLLVLVLDGASYPGVLDRKARIILPTITFYLATVWFLLKELLKKCRDIQALSFDYVHQALCSLQLMNVRFFFVGDSQTRRGPGYWPHTFPTSFPITFWHRLVVRT